MEMENKQMDFEGKEEAMMHLMALKKILDKANIPLEDFISEEDDSEEMPTEEEEMGGPKGFDPRKKALLVAVLEAKKNKKE